MARNAGRRNALTDAPPLQLTPAGRQASVPIVSPGPRVPALVKSAARVLQIFDYFDEIQREAKVHEIANRLKIPQSSTSMLLKCLVQVGYLDYDSDTRTFLPSPRVALLGTWLENGPVRDGGLVRMMEDLAESTGETVILAARTGIYSNYIRVIQTRASSKFLVPQGACRLAVWSATGFALLSHENDEFVQALCLRTNAEAPSGQRIIQVKEAQTNIQQVRRQGYFFSRELVTKGTGAIAMALPNGIDRRDRPLAIGISGPLTDFAGREKEIVQQLTKCVNRYLGTTAAGWPARES
jgi:DNA-binding IclR family transcriptional regulator